MDCRGVFDALTKSESTSLGLRDRRAGMEALSLRQSMERTGTTLRWCHSHAQLADMMTKRNASTDATWGYYLSRKTWRLVYDPEFESAKKRAKRGLEIIQKDDGAVDYVTDTQAGKWTLHC
eukprot:7054229-Lingulodinium_polyedra.AAC.1